MVTLHLTETFLGGLRKTFKSCKTEIRTRGKELIAEQSFLERREIFFF